MSSNNNLLLLIIAGVIALIVLHITTSNQTCSDIPVKKVKKAGKKAPVTTESTAVTSSSVVSIKDQPQTNTVFNGASFLGKLDSSATASATYGVPATDYQITTNTLSSGVSIVSYNATNLPTGLTINTATGIISGTPTLAGVYTVQLSVTNNFGTNGYLTLTYTVSPKQLTLSNIVANSKEYDGTTAATISGSLTGFVSGDSVTFSATGTFDSATIGNNIPVILGTSSLSSSNYSVDTSSVSGLTANITKRTLSFTGTVADKVYDATTAATVTVSNVGTLVGSEVATITATGTFADKNVGTGKAVNATYTLSGANAGNYQLPATLPTLTGTITKAPLTYTATANNKEYDGTTVASVTISGITGLLTGDGSSTISITSSNSTFASANVGTGIAVTTTVTLGAGTSATDNSGNYSITQPTGLTASIFQGLSAGDVAVIGFNAIGTPDTISLLILKDLTEGTTFYVNDNEVASSTPTKFTDLLEGEASFTVKAGQRVTAGTVVVLPWGSAAGTANPISTSTYDWSSTNGFGLGVNSGIPSDEIYIYTASSITSDTPSKFIYYAQLGTSTSYVPSTLTSGTTAINPTVDGAKRYSTTCATYNACKATLLTEIGKLTTNWNTTGATTQAATDWSFTVQSSCTTPALATTGTLTSLTATYGSTSGTTTFAINTSTLISGSTVTVTAPAGFEVSTDASTGFASSLTFTSCTTTNPTLYVRLSSNINVGNYNGDITVASTGATSATIATNATKQ
jgi:hypothetical protein